MPKKMKLFTGDDKARILLILDRIKKNITESDDELFEGWCENLENMLNNIHCQDGFGTEGQDDPRGDFRNGQWSMWQIEE